MTKGCDHALEYLYHYLDEELTWSRRARIRWHLKRCVDCTGAFGFETRFKAFIRQRAQDPPPPELFDRLRTLIHEEADGDQGA